MSIDSSSAVAAANSKAGFSTEASNAATKLNADFNFFLKMLTTQLTHQDPTQPMDTTAMTQQIAQFSAVEQQVQTNSRLDQLLKSNKQSQLSTAVSYIGAEVEIAGNTGNVLGGQGAFAYILEKKAATVDIVIKNSAGAAVFKGPGTQNAGRNLLVWDGVNSFTGKDAPDGTYTIEVTAKDSNGATIGVDARAVGIVGSVETDKDGSIILNIGDVRAKYEEVLAVRTPSRIYEPPANGPEETGDTGDTGENNDEIADAGETGTEDAS